MMSKHVMMTEHNTNVCQCTVVMYKNDDKDAIICFDNVLLRQHDDYHEDNDDNSDALSEVMYVINTCVLDRDVSNDLF